MKNFRAIRTTVTVALTITMMIQPLVMVAATSDCGDEQCSETLMCAGCDCCENAKAEASCCCSTPDESPFESDDSQYEERGPEVVASDDSTKSVSGVCLCGLTVPPMDRGNERASEQIEVRQLECLTIILPLDAYEPPHGLTRPVSFSESISNPRFTQHHLCMWLI